MKDETMQNISHILKQVLIQVLRLPVQGYRYVISPLFPPCCRFYPSCSDYCLQALEKHGALTGLWLSVKRILRCHPWSGKDGLDPVPDTAAPDKDGPKQ